MAYNGFIVTYSFKEKIGDYSALYYELGSFEVWWHKMDNTWFIYTECSAPEIFSKLQPHIDNNINIIISEIPSEPEKFKGWLPKSAWSFITKYARKKELPIRK